MPDAGTRENPVRIASRSAAFAIGAALLLCSPLSRASIDAAVEAAVRPLAAALSAVVFYPLSIFGQEVPWIVLWLAIAATFFTLYLGFINLRGFGLALRLVRGDYHNPEAPGEISHFQAVATAVSGTVGIGNIGGVAVAITLGGPGAIFWMWLIGLMGMATSFFECSLAQLFKRYEPDGTYRGGPAYYLTHGIRQRGLAIVYSVLLLITFGFGFNAVQSYVVATSLEQSFGVPNWVSSFQATNVPPGSSNSFFSARCWK